MGLFSDIVVGLAVGAAKNVGDKMRKNNEAYQKGLTLSDKDLIWSYNFYKCDQNKMIGYARALKERFSNEEIRMMMREGIIKK